MRRIALFAVPLAMAVLLLVARPFFGQPDIDATGIAGRVTFEDGTPAARVQVSVTVAGRNFAFMTDGQGYYTGEALPGPATVTVGRMTVQAVLERGMTTVANLVVKVGGWQLQIVNPDGTAAPMTSAMIYYKVGDVQRTASPELAVGGRITYGTIPADTTAAAAVVTQNTGRVPRVVIQRWTFDDVQARRTLKVVLDPQVNVTIAVLGAGGVPLANAPLKVTLVGQYAIFMPASLWIPGPLPTQPYSISLPSPMTTDARGQLTFGMLPPGTYRLSMENSDVAGAPLDCVVKDGTVTPATYTLAVKTRTITQTVFGYDGKPAPGTKVRATFARDGKVAQLDAIADAAGKVTWKDLPVSRIIVTGDGVPEGVLDDAVETVTTALPAPAPDARTVSVRFIAPADVTDPIAWRIYSRASGMRRNTESAPVFRRTLSAIVPDHPMYAALYPGTAFTLVAATQEATPRVAAILNGFIPYLPKSQTAIEYPLTFTPSIAAALTFTSPGDPTPARLPGVSRVQVWPTAPSNAVAPGSALVSMWRQVGMLTANESLDGVYAVHVPSAGSYCIGVDLFDETSKLPESCTVDIAPRTRMGAIALPAPLATVPAGTHVGRLARNAAGYARELTIGASQDAMPVFGPRDSLLALWYKPTPRELVIWRPGAAEQRLPLKPTILQPRVPLEAGQVTDYRLFPLLPAAHDDVGTFLPGPRADSERVGMRFSETCAAMPTAVVDDFVEDLPVMPGRPRILPPPPQPGLRADLWTGQYLLTSEPTISDGLGASAIVTLPAGGGSVAAPLATCPAEAEPTTRAMFVQFPQANYGELRTQAVQNLLVTFDVPGEVTIPASNLENRFNLGIDVPVLGANADAPMGAGARFIAPPVGDPAAMARIMMPPAFMGLGMPIAPVSVPAAARTMTIVWPGVGEARNVPLPADVANAKLLVPAWTDGTMLSGHVLRADGQPAGNIGLAVTWPEANPPVKLMMRTDAGGHFAVKGALPGITWVVESNAAVAGGIQPVYKGGYRPPYMRAIDGADPMPVDAKAAEMAAMRDKLQAELQAMEAAIGKMAAVMAGAAPDERAKLLAEIDAQRQRMMETKARMAGLDAGTKAIPPTKPTTPAGWAPDVPAGGLTDVTLRMAETPSVITISGVTQEGSMVWWLADGERPVLVPYVAAGGSFAGHALTRKPGWFWAGNSTLGACWAGRIPLGAGPNVLTCIGPCPTLGIAFPFDINAGLPGAVTLIGKGAREGFRATLTAIRWQPSPQLGLVVCQVDAVPPGEYRVEVVTRKGTVTATATVTERGGFVALSFPMK